MNENQIKICDQIFEKKIDYFLFKWPFTEINDMKELIKLKEFPNLKGASFGSTNLNDEGLKYVCECTSIENLNLQDTKISNQGIELLANLKDLKYLRLKENDQLTNICIMFFNQLTSLIDLQIHETSINQKGLQYLKLPQLKDLLVNIWNDNYSFDFLINLSLQLTNCQILAKGKGEFFQGEFTGNWT